MFIVTILAIGEFFKIVTFILEFCSRIIAKVKKCNTLTIATAVESYGIQEVRGSIPLVSTK